MPYGVDALDARLVGQVDPMRREPSFCNLEMCIRDSLDGDQAVEDLGNLLFEQPLEELVGRARENDRCV